MKRHHNLVWLCFAVLAALSGSVAQAASLDLNGSTISYTAGSGINNAVTVSVTGSSFVFNDTAETITTGIANATGSGSNSVSVPFAGVTNVTLALGDGTDQIAGSGVVLTGTTATMTITHSGLGLTIAGPLTTAATTGLGISITASGTGGITQNGAIASSNSNISIASNNDLSINSSINSGSGTIALLANQDAAGSESLTQAPFGATITTTNTSGTALVIQVNTSGGGTGNANLRAIAATGGTLNVQTFGGSILYAGTDALDVQQAAQTTLAPGLLGPAGSATNQGGSGTAPSGTINAKTYLLSTSSTGSGSIGTAARPIQTTIPASNTETLTAGSGGIYFVDWGNPLSLTSATATGVSASATVGGANFSGAVYMCCNRDTGNTEQLLMSGTIVTSNTSAAAVVIEGFHAAGNGTNAGTVTVNNVTVGNGGTIIVSGVPATLPSGQGTILASSASSLLNAGANGTVKFIATTVASTTTSSAAVGTTSIPMKVTAGNVIVVANSGVVAGLTSYPDNVYITDTIGANFSATTGSTSPSGSINFTTTTGMITVNGTTSTGNNAAINLTSTGAGGGVNINAPLGNSATGNITINAGANPVALNSFFAPTSTEIVSITSANGLVVSSTGTLAGSWSSPNTIPVTVQSGGTISPGDTSVATFPAGNLAIAAGATFRADLNSSSSFDALNVTGTVDVTGSTLAIFVNAPISQGTSFTLISNDGTDPVVGQFVGGTTVTSVNDARYVFAINYAGGDGNDVVATLTSNPAGTLFDVTNGVITVLSEPAVNNVLSVTQSAGKYTFTDPSTTYVLSPNAVAAGWTLVNSHTATGPTTGINNMAISLFDGTDSITGIDAGSAAVNIQGTGSMAVSGSISSTSSVSIKGVTDISVSGAAILFKGTTVTLTSTNSVGTSLQPISTQATAIVANTGAGGVYLIEADGADVTATATGAGNIVVLNKVGTLNIAGVTSTVTGNISLTSADAVTVSANVNAGSGTITIAANTDGAGSEGYDQKGATLTTTNITGSALTINVNTAAGGTGDAVIGQANIGVGGSNPGGTITVNSNAGNILWSSDPAYGGVFGGSLNGTANSGSNTQTLRAHIYSFTCTGSAGIGTDPRPIQVDNFGPDSVVASPDTVTASAGDGGVYIVGWDQNGNDLTVGNITATGPGNIRVVAANAGGHDLFVDGNVTTGSGYIQLYADDDLIFTNNAHVGGPGFSGTVDIRQDRDNANGEFFYMAPNSSIVTSNNSSGSSSPAVLIQGFSSAGSSDAVVATDVKGGGIELANIQVGAGGSIVVNAQGNPSGQGSIVQQSGTLLDVGGSTGSIYLIAVAVDASGSTNGTAGFTLGNIGYGGSASAPIPLPITTNAGSINATAVGTTLMNTGNINIVATSDASFFVNTIGNTTGTITLATTSGVLTIPAVTSTFGGTITLSGAGGVALASDVGSSTTGAISITGALSGTGNIITGIGSVTVSQSTSSTYAGVISGPNGFFKAGSGTLTLSAAQSYTGAPPVTAGGLAVNRHLYRH